MAEASGKLSSKNPALNWAEAKEPARSASWERSLIASLRDDLSELSIKSMLLQAGENYSLICFDASALASAAAQARELADRPILLFDSTMPDDVLGALLTSSPVLAVKPTYLGAIRSGPKKNQPPEPPALQGCDIRRRLKLSLSRGTGPPMEVEVYEIDAGSLGDAGALRTLKESKSTPRIGEGPDNLRGREDYFQKRQEKRQGTAKGRRSPKQQ
jgi:hypothetical protein